MTGDKDDGNPDAGVDQLALKIQAIDPRKPHVQNQATWRVRALAAQERLRCPEGLGMQAHRFQQPLDRGPHHVIVVDNEYGGRACGRHSCVQLRLAE